MFSSRTYQTLLFIIYFSLVSAASAFAVGCHEPAPGGAVSLRYNETAVRALDREIAADGTDERYGAVLRGLRWCVAFCDDDENFDFTFTNYLTMLDELTLRPVSPAVSQILHALILREFERALPRLPRLFAADGEGYEDFISVLPIAYHHRVPVLPLRKFAARHFSHVMPVDRLAEFRKAAEVLDYDRLTDLTVGAAFIDMAYRWGADKDFPLPPDNYRVIMRECGAIPFMRRYREDAYDEQNYWATHILLALTHYGQKPLLPSPIGDRVFFYLMGQYQIVRHQLRDLDLLCEYLYCFRQFAPMGVEFIDEGERYVMSLQRPDGAWGTADDFAGDPYDRLHPTWTAITLLIQRGETRWLEGKTQTP